MNPIISAAIVVIVVLVIAFFVIGNHFTKVNRLKDQKRFTALIKKSNLSKQNQDLEDELFKILRDLPFKGIKEISEPLKVYLNSCLSNALRLRRLFGSIGNWIKDEEKRKILKDVYLFNVIRESPIENIIALYISCLEGGNSLNGYMMYGEEMNYLSILVYKWLLGNNEREIFFSSVYKNMEKLLSSKELSKEERIILAAEKLKFFYAYRHFIG
jgi:hypothetical protein